MANRACSIGFWQCKTLSCVQWRAGIWVGWCEQYMKKYQLTDVKLRVRITDEGPHGHFWNGTSFSNDGYPVALCSDFLYPRDPMYFMTSEEMKQVPFCQKCLSMLDK